MFPWLRDFYQEVAPWLLSGVEGKARRDLCRWAPLA